MTNLFSKFYIILSKNISRKNLNSLINEEIKKFKKKRYKVLNIGSGGPIENYLKTFEKFEVFSIDIDKNRNPDQLINLCDKDFVNKLKIKPDLIMCFEVLEHIKEPQVAIANLHKICSKKCTILMSVPFNFPIHDAPNDFYRYTKFGLEYLFRNFSTKKIINRDGWLDCIFVFIIRLKFSKNIFLKIISFTFLVLYYLLYPVISLIQQLIKFENITTGYFLIIKK